MVVFSVMQNRGKCIFSVFNWFSLIWIITQAVRNLDLKKRATALKYQCYPLLIGLTIAKLFTCMFYRNQIHYIDTPHCFVQ